jgi:MFS family permease
MQARTAAEGEWAAGAVSAAGEEARPYAGGRLGAFRSPAYRLYWIGQLTTNAGSWLQIVASGWLVLELTDSPAALGLNAAFQAIPILALSLVGGVIADRIDRYRLMVWSQVAQIVPDVLLAVLIGTGQVRVEYVFAYSLITATINGLATPGRQALVPRLVPAEALVSAIALNSILWQGAAVVGPAVAGVVLAAWGIAGNFYLNAASDLVSLGTLLLIRLPPVQREPVEQSAWQHLLEGTRYAWQDRRVRFVLLVAGGLSLLGRPYTQIMPVFARDVFGVGPEGLGLLLTMPAVGTIVGAILLSLAAPKQTLRWLLLTGVVLGVSLTAFGLTHSFWPALAALAVVGGAGSASATLANTLLQQVVDERVRGRVMSFFMAATWGSWRLGALPAGLVAQVWGAPLACVLSGVLLLAALAPSVSRGQLSDTDN